MSSVVGDPGPVGVNSDEAIDLALSLRRWAVVGCSPDVSRPSNEVARFLLERDYDVIPVRPGVESVLGRRAFDRLRDIPGPVDVVDIFRRGADAGSHVDEAIELGARAVWMQIGVIDRAAAERAQGAGLAVVMDRCPKIELPRRGTRS